VPPNKINAKKKIVRGPECPFYFGELSWKLAPTLNSFQRTMIGLRV
jgi:hypothetical protein